MLWAYVVKVGRQQEERGTWRPARQAAAIQKGPHKGLYRVTLHDGSHGVARTVKDSGGGYDRDSVQA